MPLSSDEYASAIKLANQLRSKGKQVDIDFDDRKLGNKFNRAAKIAKYAIVVGSDEAASGNYQAKDLATGETEALSL